MKPGAKLVPNGLTLYLAGPKRGRPSYNAPAFDAAAASLRAAGYSVRSCVEEERRDGFDHETRVATPVEVERFQRLSLALLESCGGVAIMDDWHLSAGVRAQMAQAREDGQPVATVRKWLELAKENRK
jgi:hypothetical protein